MKALSLTQPWASMVASGIKRIENRTWAASPKMIGQRFAIHASAKSDVNTLHTAKRLFLDKAYGYDIVAPYPTMAKFPRGAVIGVATLERVAHAAGALSAADLDAIGILPDQQRWFFGPYGFVLRDVRLVNPITCRGALGFWELPDDVAAELNAALAEAEAELAP